MNLIGFIFVFRETRLTLKAGVQSGDLLVNTAFYTKTGGLKHMKRLKRY